MNARALALLFAAVTLAPASFSWADAEEEAKAQVVLVDFASIPAGALPAVPAQASAPTSAPAARVTDAPRKSAAGELKVEPVSVKPSLKRSTKRLHKKKKGGLPNRAVEIKPATASLGLLYTPAENVNEFDGDSPQRLSCGGRAEVAPLRWEKLTFEASGSARLEIDDLWFDPQSCSVWPGSTSVVTLKAIAWDKGVPWLFAMRSDSSVTFVMPRSNDMSAETMVGAPLTVRGGFTRVTMPIGRWGSASLLAELPSLSIDPPSKTGPPSKSGAKAPDGKDRPDPRPVELGVELVQTMAEKYPTLLVRTREPAAVALNSRFE